VARFRRVHAIAADFTLGASGQLAKQIRQGAPFDVFLSANRKFVADLAEEKIIRPDSVRSYARGMLVLAVRRESAGEIKTLNDLARPEIKKIALANPDFAPYGLAGKQALERSKLWGSVEPKIVRAETVRQALQFVETGNADAGLVSRASAETPELRTIAVDGTLYDPIVQALGIVAATKEPSAAEAFARFLLGDAGQAILGEYGFVRVDAR
jgi:molybdate transport system substrate-binding protein